MKKIIILISVLLVALFAQAQYPYGRLYNPNQRLGSDSALVTSYGGLKGRLVVWNFSDTTAANLQAIKNYSGAFIFTTDSNKLWVRNRDINEWLHSGGTGSGSITNFTMITDSTIQICYSDGSCDTVSFVNNFFTTNNNVEVLNDSTLIICVGVGAERVCDTIEVGVDSIFNFFFLNDSTLVVCEEFEIICIGDSCYQQTLCDTIPIPRITGTVYQNLTRKLPNTQIVEGGDAQFTTQAYMNHDTYYYTRGYQLNVTGLTSERPPFYVRQDQWSQLSSSAVGFSHFGRYPNAGLIDSANAVSLYLNYFDPFVGDTNGFFGDRIGYAWMTNSRGRQENYVIEDDSSKQVGILFHTLDVENTDGVTIFAQQVPSAYNFGNNPPVDSNLVSKRIMVFKTDQDYQVPNYPNTRNDGAAALAFYPDENGNVKLGAVAGSGDITIINDTTIVICSFGEFLCDTFITTVDPVQMVFVINDSTLLVCDTLNNCDTVNLGGGSPGFDRGFFDPNQTSLGDTRHQTDGHDLAVGRNYTLSPTGTSDNFLFGNGSIINANATRNFVAISNNTVSGSENTVFGRNMVVAGNSNFSGSTDGQIFSTANYAAQFGDANTTRGTASFTVNFGNKTWAENGSTFGSNNVNGSLNPTVGTANLYTNSFVSGINNFSLGHSNFVSGSNVTANNTTGFITMFGKDYTVTTANSFNVGYTTNAFEITANKVRINEARFQEYKGTTTAAANDLTLPNNGNYFTISGSTQINAILTTNWQAASTIGFTFTGAPLLKHNTAGGAGTATMLLAGSVDFQAAIGDNIEFRYDGTNWQEIGRTIATGGGGANFTVDNGLSLSTPTNGQLGGTLIKNTEVVDAGFTMTFSNNTATTSLLGTNSSAGVGVHGESSSGYGVFGFSTTGQAAQFTINPATTNSVATIANFTRNTTGTGANGIGGSLDLYVENATSTALSNQIVTKWVDAANATRTSQLDVLGTGNAASVTIMSAYAGTGGGGIVGIGISSAYTATRLEVVDNTVASASIMKLTSSSTGNSHRGVDVTFTGAIANSSQTTSCIVGINSNTGTGLTTYGVVGTTTSTAGGVSAGVAGTNGSTGWGGFFTSNGAGTAIEAQGPTTGIAIQGSVSTSGVGVRGNTASGVGVMGYSSTGVPLAGLIDAAPTGNDVMTGLSLSRRSNVAVGDGIGVSISMALKTSTTADVFSNSITSVFTTSTHASRTSNLYITGVTAAATETWFTFGQSGSVKFRPMTVTEAGAIATAEGLMVFVSNTDATFTSVGLWIYQNGAWKAL